MQGHLTVVLTTIDQPPFIGGVQIFLLEKPNLKFSFIGGAKYFAKLILDIVNTHITEKMGYPNSISMQLTDQGMSKLIVNCRVAFKLKIIFFV